MNGQVLRAMQGLSETLYRGMSDIGSSRLRRAQLGLEESKARYTMGREKEKWALEKPGLELQAQQATAQTEWMNQPFTMAGLANSLNMDAADVTSWGVKIANSLRQVGVKFNSKTGGFEQAGEPVTNAFAFQQNSPILGVIIAETDPVRNLETRADQGDTEAQKLLDNPKALINEYDNKVEILRQMQSANWITPASRKLLDNKILDAQKKITRLEKHVPTKLEEERLGLLEYQMGTERLKREKELKGTEVTIKDKAAARKQISNLEKSWAQLKAKGVTEQTMKGVSPNLQAILMLIEGKKLTEEDLQPVREAYMIEIENLVKDFGLEEYKGVLKKLEKKGKTTSGKPITHRFIMGQGLVPVE